MEQIQDAVYLVDLENIGTRSLYHHTDKHPDSEYIIFYSDSTSSPGSILEHLPCSMRVSFVDCHTGGNNAMDFCICATAGRFGSDKGRVIRIFSDDKGYDPMILMMQQQGIRIARERSTYIPPKETDEKHIAADTACNDKSYIIEAIRKHVPKQWQQTVIESVPDAVDRKEAHEMLQAILPQKMVADIYKKLKKYIPKNLG